MHKIFSTLPAAQTYADECQTLVMSTRPRYTAVCWDVPYKHPTLPKWAIVMPPEDASQGVELTEDWFPSEVLR